MKIRLSWLFEVPGRILRRTSLKKGTGSSFSPSRIEFLPLFQVGVNILVFNFDFTVSPPATRFNLLLLRVVDNSGGGNSGRTFVLLDQEIRQVEVLVD